MPPNLVEVRNQLIRLTISVQSEYRKQVKKNPRLKKEMITTTMDLMDASTFAPQTEKILTGEVWRYIYEDQSRMFTLISPEVLASIPEEYVDFYMFIFACIARFELKDTELRKFIVTMAADYHIRKANGFIQKNKWADVKFQAFDACQLLQNVELDNPARLIARYYAGICYVRDGKLDQARQQFQFALEEYKKLTSNPNADLGNAAEVVQDIHNTLQTI